MIREYISKKFETPFYCSICCLYTNSQSILEIHFNSEKHKTKQKIQQKMEKDFDTVRQILEPVMCKWCCSILSENLTNLAFRSNCCRILLCNQCVLTSKELNLCVYCKTIIKEGID